MTLSELPTTPTRRAIRYAITVKNDGQTETFTVLVLCGQVAAERVASMIAAHETVTKIEVTDAR